MWNISAARSIFERACPKKRPAFREALPLQPWTSALSYGVFVFGLWPAASVLVGVVTLPAGSLEVASPFLSSSIIFFASIAGVVSSVFPVELPASAAKAIDGSTRRAIVPKSLAFIAFLQVFVRLPDAIRGCAINYGSERMFLELRRARSVEQPLSSSR
jgi:hypothetical protein